MCVYWCHSVHECVCDIVHVCLPNTRVCMCTLCMSLRKHTPCGPVQNVDKVRRRWHVSLETGSICVSFDGHSMVPFECIRGWMSIVVNCIFQSLDSFLDVRLQHLHNRPSVRGGIVKHYT